MATSRGAKLATIRGRKKTFPKRAKKGPPPPSLWVTRVKGAKGAREAKSGQQRLRFETRMPNKVAAVVAPLLLSLGTTVVAEINKAAKVAAVVEKGAEAVVPATRRKLAAAAAAEEEEEEEAAAAEAAAAAAVVEVAVVEVAAVVVVEVVVGVVVVHSTTHKLNKP